MHQPIPVEVAAPAAANEPTEKELLQSVLASQKAQDKVLARLLDQTTTTDARIDGLYNIMKTTQVSNRAIDISGWPLLDRLGFDGYLKKFAVPLFVVAVMISGCAAAAVEHRLEKIANIR